MVRISRNRKLKSGLLVLSIFLMVAQGLAVSWNSPEGDSSMKADITLNVTNENDAANVTFEVKKPGESSFEELKTKTSQGSSDYVTHDYKAGSTDYGDHEFKVSTSSGSDSNQTVSGVTLDGDSPEIDSKSPEGYISDDSPTVELETSDPTTSVDETNISVNGSDDSGSSSAEVSLSDLDDDEYTVDYTIKDEVGNWKNGSWDFDVDTSYDGDTSPEFDPEPGIVELESDEDTDLTVTLDEEDESTDITVTCYDSDDDEIDSETQDVSGSTDFTCNIDGDDYSGSEEDIYVEMCDEAGNCESSDSKTYTFDGSAPNIFNLETSSGASSFNSNFSVDFEASDDASGVEEVEYFFDVSTDEGDGASIDYSSDDSSFTVEPGDDLASGAQTLYVRAKDEAGRWGGYESLEFDYYPGKTPQVTLASSSEIQIISGNSKSFTVTVENTGDLYISSVDVTISSPIVSGSKTVEDLAENDSKSVTFDIDTKNQDIGDYTLEISTGSPSDTREVDLRVKANSEQEEDIRSNFTALKGDFDQLKANVTELEKDLNEERRQRLMDNFSAVNDTINSAQSALDEGNIYEVSSAIDGLQDDLDKASQSFKQVKKEHEEAQQQKLILAGAGVIFLLLIAGLGALFYTGHLELKVLKERGIDVGGSVQDTVLKIEAKLKGAEEAEEFEWDGFQND